MESRAPQSMAGTARQARERSSHQPAAKSRPAKAVSACPPQSMPAVARLSQPQRRVSRVQSTQGIQQRVLAGGCRSQTER